MKLRTSFLICVLLITSCASLADGRRRAAVQAEDTAQLLRDACALYNENRDLVIEFRSWAIANKEKFPPLLWQKLEVIDSKLPLLDALGARTCEAADAAAVIDRADASTLKGALELIVSLAGILKQLGVL